MAKVTINETTLDGIADAIRAQLGVSTTYKPAQMPNAIRSIEKANLESLTATDNGTYLPRLGKNGFDRVVVDVPSAETTLITKSISVNGAYSASSDNADGYSSVIVDVPNTYEASDEGKVVSSGTLVAQTSQSITANGTYDTTTKNQVVVDVQGGGGGDTADATLSSGGQMLSGVTAYARGSKYTGTIESYAGSINSGAGSIPYWSGSYEIIPSAVAQSFPMAGKVMRQDLVVGAGGSGSAVLSDISITSNGTYSAAGSGVDGFANVVVNVPSEAANLGDITITSNGNYPASQSNLDGFSNVTVNVPSPSLKSIAISANGTYYASDYNTYGFSAVKVNISVPDAVMTTTIERSAFANNSEIRVAAFPKVSVIASDAFRSCSSLVMADFPECEQVGGYAFYRCYSLSQVYFPECEQVGTSAFGQCSQLQSIDLPNCSVISGGAFEKCSSLSRISIPSCTSIGYNAFASCVRLVSVYAPECLTVGAMGFTGCYSLEYVHFPKCVELDIYAFSYNTRLTSIAFEQLPSVPRSCFAGCASLQDVSLPACEYIDVLAFRACGMSYIYLPSCTRIACGAFYGCKSLASVSLPNLTTLENGWYVPYYAGESSRYMGTFQSAVMSSVYLPRCSYVGSAAFSGCLWLETVSLPACQTIGLNAFDECMTLTSMYLMGSSVCDLSGGQLAPSFCFSADFTIYVPSSLVADYRASANWSNYSGLFSGI